MCFDLCFYWTLGSLKAIFSLGVGLGSSTYTP